MRLDVKLTAELPNRNLHKFKGSAVVADERYRAPLTPGAEPQFAGPPDAPATVQIPVTMNEMLLRGCMLKNSGAIVGLVVYTGRETRIQVGRSVAAAPVAAAALLARCMHQSESALSTVHADADLSPHDF